MDDDIAAIEAWAQIFTNPTQLAATLSKHYAFHRKEIQADVTTLETDWDAKSFFQSGQDLASLMIVAVGPIQGTLVGLPPFNAAPDFVAGLIYGFTGDNHLDELRTCMTDADEILLDTQKALGDVKSLHLLQAAEDVGQVIWDLPDAVSGCQGLDGDMAEIEAWAAIFKDPVQLGKTVSKHWLFHGPAIKKDLAQQKSDWAAQNYFAAGQDAAKVIEGLVGPVEKLEQLPPPPLPLNAVPDFVAGLIFGFTGNNHLDELETCLNDADQLVKDAEVVISDVKEIHLVQSAKDIGTIIWELPDAVSGCTGMDDDIAAIEAWAQIFKQPAKLTQTVTKNWLFHGEDAKKMIEKQNADWAAKDYYDAGDDAAQVIIDLVGPVKKAKIPLFGIELN